MTTWLLVSWSITCLGNDLTDTSKTTPFPDAWLVGAYYYPWYDAPADERSLGWMRKALRGRLKPKQLPALGIYSSRNPETINAHIRQSVQAGIDFWAVSWWGPGKREDRALLQHILPHPSGDKLKYAVLYESTGRLGTFEKPDYSRLLSDFEYLNMHYFHHPAYLKIDDKPVVFLYLTRVYFRNRGHEALAALREKFPNLFLIGDEVFGPRYRANDAKPWDAITAYDVYGQSMKIEGPTRMGVDRLLNNYRHAKKMARTAGTAFVPGIAPGYNDRAVRNGHPGRPRYFTDDSDSVEGDIFRTMIRDVAIPLADDAANRMWMITSFNEWYEDTQIEPTAGAGTKSSTDDSESGRFFTEGDVYEDYGDLYLNILREELTASETAP